MPDVAAWGGKWGLETGVDPVETAGMMTDYASPPTLLLIAAAVGLILGMLLAKLFSGAAKRLAAAATQLGEARAEIDARDVRIIGLEREVAQARDQVRPLSDEVDRFRREAAQRKAARAGVEVPIDVPAPAVPDHLTILKGVGDKFATKLGEIGVSRIQQVADLTPGDAQVADANLGPFAGRIARDQLVEQARLLVTGRTTEYEARFGKIGS